VDVLNLGGGFKVARGDLDKATDIRSIAASALQLVANFNSKTGRNLRIEIEPGSFLVANAGVLISEVMDVMSTKRTTHTGARDDGHNFIKLNTGLNDLTRPALYGAQHSLKFFPQDGSVPQ
jgi:diaminopimelate decarboxylase